MKESFREYEKPKDFPERHEYTWSASVYIGRCIIFLAQMVYELAKVIRDKK